MKLHLSTDIQGFLATHIAIRDYEGIFRHDDGHLMTGREARLHLLYELGKGRRLIASVGCDNFDFQKGCLGHPE